jgi:hypothetical protein
MISENVIPTLVDLECFVGNDIDFAFSCMLDGVAEDMSTGQLDIVIEDFNGATIRTGSSAGTSPTIAVSTSVYNWTDTPFLSPSDHFYYVNYTKSGKVFTIQKGKFTVKLKAKSS